MKRHHFADSWLLAPFRGVIHEPRYWGIRRRTVVPAVALGLFVAFMPFPGHPLLATLLALALRVNIPIAAVTTFISNPVTMGPMYYGAYRLGRSLLDLEPVPFDFEMSMDWVTHTFVEIWQPMTLGSLLLGITAATLAYISLDILWRISLRDYKTRKRNERNRSD